MSQRQQLDQFDTNFVKSSIREWSKLSATYEEQSKKVYKKIRSYLTLYQFRLSNQQRCDVREMLSQELDEIESSANIMEEMDSFLDGYCFELDKSILPKKIPTAVKIQIAPETQTKTTFPETALSQTQLESAYTTACQTPSPSPRSDNETSLDTDFDFYTYQFFQ